MKVHLILACVLGALRLVSGYDFFKQFGACFDVYETPSICNRPLSRSFTPKSPLYGVNEPTTLVYLFTPDNPDKAEALHECGGRLPPDSRYDPDAETEVFIHGFLDGICRTAWMREMKEQLYQRGRYNVILIDWSWDNRLDYYGSAGNSKVVGEQVGFVINNIMNQTGVGGEKFHIVGHSFGAVGSSSFIGRSVRGLRRITALDPSYAPFGDQPPNQRLTYKDAGIVDIIHTNAYSCFALGHGDKRQLGHADFYPNGGQIQASCYSAMLQAFLKMDILSALYALLSSANCSHLTSIQYYKTSINPKGCEFVGIASPSYRSYLKRRNSTRLRANQWAVMGMDYERYRSSDGRRRKFYLKTSPKCPYYDDSYIKGKKFPFSTSCSPGRSIISLPL